MSDERTYSIVVPTYNEENDIEQCLTSLLDAKCDADRLEVLVVDGMSEDATRDIVHEYEGTHSAVRLLDNPDQTTPHAINIGFTESTNDIVVLIGGHSWVPNDFFERIDQAFDERAPDADVVGGVMVPAPTGYFESAVTGALTSRLGSSSTRFRPVEGYTETVNYGAYRRDVIEEVGPMDVGLPRAQDYEYNRRVIEHGYRIYQYPEIRVMYRPRSSPRKLVKQYFGSGYWKAHVFEQYGDYPLPIHTVGRGALAVGGLLLVFAALSTAVLGGLLAVGGIYSVLVLLSANGAIANNEQLTARHGPGVVCALVGMHVSYAVGLLYGMVDNSTSRSA